MCKNHIEQSTMNKVKFYKIEIEFYPSKNISDKLMDRLLRV